MIDRRAATARTLVSAAAAGVVAGVACASKPPLSSDGQASPELGPGADAVPAEVVLAPPSASPTTELTAVARPATPPEARLDRGCCKAKNECKGKGMCKTEQHDCKGLNECKGQGGCKPIDC